jgi:hypothetical protein
MLTLILLKGCAVLNVLMSCSAALKAVFAAINPVGNAADVPLGATPDPVAKAVLDPITPVK